MINPSLHNPTPEYFNELLDRIQKSQRWVAETTGIDLNRIERLKRGTYSMRYPEQYILEQLADAMEVARRK